MVLLLIVIVINVEGNGFFGETWFGYIAVNGESPFYGNCETTEFFFFFFLNVTWTVIVSLPLKKIIQYASQNKTTCGNMTVIS